MPPPSAAPYSLTRFYFSKVVTKRKIYNLINFDKSMQNMPISLKSAGIMLEFLYVDKNFSSGKKEIEGQGYRLASLKEYALLRNNAGPGLDFLLGDYGAWTKEGFIYIPKGEAYEVYLTKNSPINEFAENAFNGLKPGDELYLDDKQLKNSLTGAIKLLDRPISTDHFNACNFTRYAFEEYAEGFGKLLKSLGNDSVPVFLSSHANKEKKPFARQCYIETINNQIEFCGDFTLNNHKGIIGIKEINP
jgi:hypothetical protein